MATATDMDTTATERITSQRKTKAPHRAGLFALRNLPARRDHLRRMLQARIRDLRA